MTSLAPSTSRVLFWRASRCWRKTIPARGVFPCTWQCLRWACQRVVRSGIWARSEKTLAGCGVRLDSLDRVDVNAIRRVVVFRKIVEIQEPIVVA